MIDEPLAARIQRQCLAMIEAGLEPRCPELRSLAERAAIFIEAGVDPGNFTVDDLVSSRTSVVDVLAWNRDIEALLAFLTSDAQAGEIREAFGELPEARA